MTKEEEAALEKFELNHLNTFNAYGAQLMVREAFLAGIKWEKEELAKALYKHGRKFNRPPVILPEKEEKENL